jgi:hypothetical protein
MLLDDDGLVGNNNIVDNENCRAERMDYLRRRMDIVEAILWLDASSTTMKSEKRQLQYYY